METAMETKYKIFKKGTSFMWLIAIAVVLMSQWKNCGHAQRKQSP